MAEKKKTPDIRFEGFSGDWVEYKLEELGKSTGGTSIEAEFVESGKYKVISIGSYSEQSTYTEQGIRANNSEKINKRILNKDDLTMILNDKTSSGRIIGRVLLIEADNTYVYNQRTERIEIYREKFVPKFLYQMLNADIHRSKIVKSSQGNTQIYVNWSAISQLTYLLPENRYEQEIIANFLLQLDNLIALQQRKYDKTVNMKKACLEKMFPQKGAKVPEVRFAGFSGDWMESKFDVFFDCSISNNTLSRSELNYESGEVKNIHYGDILVKYGATVSIVKDGLPFISNGVLADYKSRLLQDGDIILADTAEDETVGKAVEISESHGSNVVAGLHTIACRPKMKMKPLYLGYYMNSYSYRHQLLSLMQGVKVLSLSKSNLSKTSLLSPVSPDEQTKIGEYFRQLDNLIALYAQELEKLKNIKKACLEKMFV